MHDDIGMADWFPFVIVGVAAIIFFGSIAVVIDSIRRPKSHFGRLGRWPYIAVQGFFLALTVFGTTSPTDLTYTVAVGVMILVASVQMIVYLLRVVFPSSAKRAEREAAREEARNLASEATEEATSPSGTVSSMDVPEAEE